MSLENDFLVFAGASGANVLTQAAYAAASATATGYVSGVASSAAVNKTLRQTSIMAAMIAQFIVDKTTQPVIDDGTIATIETNFEAAILAIADTVNIPMSQVTGLTAALAGYLPLHATADSAAKLATARNIALTGAVIGAVNFDGSSNVSIATTLETIAANSLLANPTGSVASPQAITLANGLQFSGTALGLGSITVTGLASSGACISTLGPGAFQAQSTTTSSASIYLTNSASSGRNWEVASAGGVIDPAGNFYIRDITAGANRLRIDTAGNATIVNGALFAQGIVAANGYCGGNGSLTIQPTYGSTTNQAVLNSAGALTLAATIQSTYWISTASNFGQITGTGASGTAYLWGASGSGDNICNVTRAGSSNYNWTYFGGITTTGTVNFNTSDATLKRLTAAEPRPLHHASWYAYERIDTGEHGFGPTAQGIAALAPDCVRPYEHSFADGTTATKLALARDQVALETATWAAQKVDELLLRVSALESK